MVKPSDNPAKHHNFPQVLPQLIEKYPWAFGGTLWAGVLVVGSVAGFGMIYAGPVEQEASVPQPTITTIQQFTTGSKPQPRSLIQEPVAIQPPAAIQEPVAIQPLSTIQPQPAIATIPESAPGEGFPLSVLAGLAIGCGAGSFIVAQLVKKANQPDRGAKTLNKTQKISKKQRPVARKTSAARSNSTLSSPYHQPRHYQPPVMEKQQTKVTVVSASENHPLDKREETLAEMLDLRKRKSLSSLMREE